MMKTFLQQIKKCIKFLVYSWRGRFPLKLTLLSAITDLGEGFAAPFNLTGLQCNGSENWGQTCCEAQTSKLVDWKLLKCMLIIQLYITQVKL